MSKPTLFQIDKSLEKPERVMLAGVMLSADYTGANELREQAFQAALNEAAELVRAAGGDLVRTETAKRDKAHTAWFVGTGTAEELAGKRLTDYGLGADGIGTVDWPGEGKVISSVDFVHLKDAHYHPEVADALGVTEAG